jgi:arabinose-5-phosphate isomerase
MLTPKSDSQKKSKPSSSLIETAKRVLKIESDAVAALANRLSLDFSEAVHVLNRKEGRLFVTGMGKSGLIGKKIAATMSSVGLPAVFVHAAEGVHGDLGLVSPNDRVIAISNSGETEEILRLLPTLSRLKCTLITMTGNLQSTLANRSEYVLDIGVKEEAGGNGLIPTTSTTATLAMGDALVVAYLDLRGFHEEDFALNHPGGSLGRKMLTTVEDLMHAGNEVPMVYENADISKILSEMMHQRIAGKAYGTTLVTDKKKLLKGIITDGDLRRMIVKEKDLSTAKASDLMGTQPKWIKKDELAAKALQLMEEYAISSLAVSEDGGEIDGIIHLHDLLKAGIA